MPRNARISSIVTSQFQFRCPVCGRTEPRYNSIIICTMGRDRTICIDCATMVAEAMAQLHKDDKEN